jgi:hypothetical protein
MMPSFSFLIAALMARPSTLLLQTIQYGNIKFAECSPEAVDIGFPSRCLPSVCHKGLEGSNFSHRSYNSGSVSLSHRHHESNSSAISKPTDNTMANLYAEYLPNIKTLTVTTVLDTPRNNTTALWLSNDRTKLVLEHDDRTYRITVPARLPGQGSQHLQLPNTGELQCVNRIPTVPIFGQEDPVILWSATSLDQDTRVHCKHCGTLVSSDKIHVWKDLPSEAWAEMMDLWHCHKPEEPESNPDDDAPAQKGYAAGSKLIAQVGVGLVDVMSFLLSEHDCTVEVSYAFYLLFIFLLLSSPLFAGFKKECSVTTVASIRYRFDTKTQDQQRCSISEQTLGSAEWVACCIDIETHPCIIVLA